ncbi:MAG: hypothetical protein ABR582_05720 [Gemmatimonadaceae bacterium]
MRRLHSTTVRRAAAATCICALSGTTGCAMMGVMRPAADSYTYDVGYASGAELKGKVAGIFYGLGYKDAAAALGFGQHDAVALYNAVVTSDEPPGPLHMETEWKRRPAADADEAARGSQIVSRITVTGIPSAGAASPTMYHVLLKIENRYVPSRGTHRDLRGESPPCSYAQVIVKGMALAFGGTPHPVANEQPRPF